MFETGNVVYHDNLVFSDKNKDIKNCRPCIVLFSLEKNNQKYVCTCPMTSTIKSFNKIPSKYCLVPEVIYNYRKLSFVKLDNISLHKYEETHYTNINVCKNTVDIIVEKIKRNDFSKINENYKQIKDYLYYINLFNELEERENKYLKKLES